jgi:hypothetical protein
MKEFFKNILAGFIIVFICALDIVCFAGAICGFVIVGDQPNAWVAILVFFIACVAMFMSIVLMAVLGYLTRQKDKE